MSIFSSIKNLFAAKPEHAHGHEDECCKHDGAATGNKDCCKDGTCDLKECEEGCDCEHGEKK